MYIWKFVLFFRKLGLDLVPRIDDRIVGPDTLGVYQLYNVVSHHPFVKSMKLNLNDILMTLAFNNQHVASAERNRNTTVGTTFISSTFPFYYLIV